MSRNLQPAMISFMAHDTLVSPHIKVVNTAYTNKLNSRLGAKAIELKHSSRQLILIRHSETQFYIRRDLFFFERTGIHRDYMCPLECNGHSKGLVISFQHKNNCSEINILNHMTQRIWRGKTFASIKYGITKHHCTEIKEHIHWIQSRLFLRMSVLREGSSDVASPYLVYWQIPIWHC
jgi:hypothetical protein